MTALSPDAPDGSFTVRDRAGTLHTLPGVAGMSVMEILVAADFEIPATCGGAAACGTCHVFMEGEVLVRGEVLVASEALDKLAPKTPEECWQLAHLRHAKANSRLACQIVWDEGWLNGLRIALAPLE